MSKIITDKNKIDEFLNSRYLEIILPSKEKAEEMLQTGNQLVFYWGIDPTGPDVHLGHTTNAFVMKKLFELGHKVILLIGSFTAMIGDPTGKDATRKVLTEKEVKENMKSYIDQLRKILPRGSFDVKYNSDWYKKMKAEDFIKLADNLTVQQMITRDMFQKRLKEEKPISLREFMYPLLQGYDSVAMNVDGEICGNDQTFNALVGRDLLKSLVNKEKLVITTKLLEDPLSGKKIMSKSEGQYISLNDSAEDIFGKTMAIPDSSIPALFSYATELSDSKISEIKHRLENKENPKSLKVELGFELAKMYHGEKEAQKAKENFERVFSQGQLPEEMKEFKIASDHVSILDTLKNSELVESASEIKRLIDQGAVTVNNKVLEKSNWNYEVKPDDVIKVGPRRFLKIVK